MYSWRKGIAQWSVCERLYLSVPFTWLMPEANKIAAKWQGEVHLGGPGAMQPSECEGFDPVLFHNPCATFTTRGCPNSCPFCAVPKLEGDFREIKNFRPAPLICDNNFTAASRTHQERVVDAVKIYPLVDFNQGLEARKFTPELADLLGKLNCHIRFAFDSWGQETVVKDAVDLCKRRTTKNISIYCLIGFRDDPDSARARLELVRSWGIWPNPMRYQPLDATEKNTYVAENWTEEKLANMTRYYSMLRYHTGIPFEDYRSDHHGIPKEQLKWEELYAE